MHGIADVITGPWDWTSRPEICEKCGENPAFVAFTDASGKKVYSLWVGGAIWTADSADGPFKKAAGYSYSGGNPAPVYFRGAFYLTTQGTTDIVTLPKLGGSWAKHASIPHGPRAPQWHTEDPFM
jgi:hypothetical protein